MVVESIVSHGNRRLEKFIGYVISSSKKESKFKEFKLPIVFYEEDDGFVAECPLFFVASQGDSIEEALNNVKEALELYLSDVNVQKTLPDNINYTQDEVMERSKKLFYEYGDANDPLPDMHYKEILVCIPINV